MNNYSRDTLCELESCIDKLAQKIEDQNSFGRSNY